MTNCVLCVLQALPSFGPFLKERQTIVARHKEEADLLSRGLEPVKVRPAFKPDKPAPPVKVNRFHQLDFNCLYCADDVGLFLI